MKNKEFLKLLKKNRSKSSSGFTLTELLVGMIMSIFVIGALGFGLMNILRVTQKGNLETAARNESSRALDFISDEMRRAQAIDVDMNVSKFNTADDPATPDIDESANMIAKDYDLPTGGTIRLSLQIPGVNQRVIYSVAPPPSSSPWKGPLVIYRWGPDLIADGSYQTDSTKAGRVNNPGGWTNEALVDGVSDKSQTQACDGTDITYQGFFACVIDDDGDTILNAAGNPAKENATDTNGDGLITAADDATDINGDGSITAADDVADKNGDGSITAADGLIDINKDGKIDAEDGADVDGKAITAQLYFTGGTTTADGSTSTYSADTKTVARARTAPENNSEDLSSYSLSFKSLNPRFSCNAGSDTEWKMRTDFGDGTASTEASRSNLAKWNHIENRQPQPIKIDDGKPLTITSIPRDASGCLNTRVQNGHSDVADQTPLRDFAGNEALAEDGDWTTDNTVVAISHTISFDDPRTFNGDIVCASPPCSNTDSGGDVLNHKPGAVASTTPNQFVKILKEGSIVPDYGGYDSNGDGDTSDTGEQDSLGKFLFDQGYAVVDGTGYKITNLEPSERIVAVEIGQTNISSTNPGSDFQDNTFIVSSKAFEKKYDKYKDGNGTTASYSPI